MTTVRLINAQGARFRLGVPDDFPMAHLASGLCRACAGTGRRDFPMPAKHPRRIPGIDRHACHDCAGSGHACAHIDSRLGVAILAHHLGGGR